LAFGPKGRKLRPAEGSVPPKYKIGDIVLLNKTKLQFEKGYAQSWSNEKFKIVSIDLKYPTTYQIVDMNKQPIFGSFYTEELQKITYS